MTNKPVLNNRILNLIAKHEALTVKDLLVHYNAIYLTKCGRGLLYTRLTKLVSEGKVYKLKDAHAEVSQRYTRYLINSHKE